MLRDLFLNLELVSARRFGRTTAWPSFRQRRSRIEERHAATCLYNARTRDGLVRRGRALRRGAPLADDRRARRAERGSTTSASPTPAHRRAPAVSGPAIALVAVWIGRARLTDNMPLGGTSPRSRAPPRRRHRVLVPGASGSYDAAATEARAFGHERRRCMGGRRVPTSGLLRVSSCEPALQPREERRRRARRPRAR